MISAVARALAAFALLGLVACAKPAPEPTTAFDGYVRDMAVALTDGDPEWAHAVGLAPSDGDVYQLTDRSDEAVVRRRAIALRTEAQLRAFEADALQPEAALTRAVLAARFAPLAESARADYGRFDPLLGFSPYVLNAPASAYEALPAHFATLARFNALRDAHRFVEALEDAANALDAETARARADFERGVSPPQFVIDDALARLERLLAAPPEQSPYLVPLRMGLISLVGAAETPPAGDPASPNAADANLDRDQARAAALFQRAQDIVARRINPAHARAAALLRSFRANAPAEPGMGRLPEGARLYAASLRAQTGLDVEAEALRDRALRRIESLKRDLDGALRVLGKTEGDAPTRLAELAADPAFRYPVTEDGGLALLNDAREDVREAMSTAQGWFAGLPQATIEVVPMTAPHGRVNATYTAQKLGGGPAYYSIDVSNPLAVSKLDLPTQNRRLAVPGMHLQRAIARENTNLPVVRRLLPIPGFAEGWGAYAEQLVEETGGFDAEPLARVGFMRRRLWDAARVVADIDMHTRSASREALIEYLRRETGFSLAEIEAEVLRAATEPGAIAAPEVGRAEFERLRERAQGGLGAEFDLRRFHDLVLKGGEMPFSTLESEIDAAIAKARKD